MSDEYEDRASALLADLRSNRSEEEHGHEEPGSSPGGKASAKSQGAKPKKKRKGRLVLVLAVLGVLGTGGYFGLVKAGIVKPPKPKPAAVVSVEPEEEEEEAEVKLPPKSDDLGTKGTKGSKSGKDLSELQKDPVRGAKKLAAVWEAMEPDALAKLAKSYKDPDLALVFSVMEPEKVASVLALMDEKRAARLSREIEGLGAVVPKE